VNRLDELTSWNADWSGLRVLVLGLGVTGFAAADTLSELGAEVTVAARSPDDERARILPVIGVDLIAIEGSDEDALPQLAALEPELLIVSPGFRRTT